MWSIHIYRKRESTIRVHRQHQDNRMPYKSYVTKQLRMQRETREHATNTMARAICWGEGERQRARKRDREKAARRHPLLTACVCLRCDT